MKLFAGVLFSLTGIFFGQAFAASMEDERFGLTGKMTKVLGGIVVRIKKGGLMDHTELLMNLVPLNRQGHPLCRKPSGHLVTVFKNRLFQAGKEHSAFVVMDDQVDPPSPVLRVGDCLTVKARKVVPISGNKTSNEDRIRIIPLARPEKKRFFQAFLIKLWPEQPAWSSGGVFSRR